MRGCQSVFKPECRVWDHPREFRTLKDVAGDLVMLMWFEWLWELKLSDFMYDQKLNPQVCRSDFSDTAHVTWLHPDVCFSYSQKKKCPKQSSWANS